MKIIKKYRVWCHNEWCNSRETFNCLPKRPKKTIYCPKCKWPTSVSEELIEEEERRIK